MSKFTYEVYLGVAFPRIKVSGKTSAPSSANDIYKAQCAFGAIKVRYYKTTSQDHDIIRKKSHLKRIYDQRIATLNPLDKMVLEPLKIVINNILSGENENGDPVILDYDPNKSGYVEQRGCVIL